MDCDGFVKISRCMLGSGLFQNPNALALWMWCLLRANWKETKVFVGHEVVDLKPGQLIFKRRMAVESLGLSDGIIYRCLKSLERRESIVTKTNNKFTIITIVNWDIYQGGSGRSEQQTDSKRQQTDSKRQQTDSSYNKAKEEEGKKGRREEEIKHVSNETYSSTDPSFDVSAPVVNPVLKCPQNEIVELWNKLMPELPNVRSWGKGSRAMLQARWRSSRDYQNIEWWRGFFIYIRGSDFLMGKKKEFTASLDWVVNPKNFEKIVNGNYENKGPKSTGSRITDQNMRAAEEFLNEFK